MPVSANEMVIAGDSRKVVDGFKGEVRDQGQSFPWLDFRALGTLDDDTSRSSSLNELGLFDSER
jgi:hypothetical protein